MTREKAIEMCKSIKHYLTAGNPVWSKEEVAEAMTMAIEALEGIPKEGDCWACNCPKMEQLRPIDPTVEVDLASGAVPRSALNRVTNPPKVTIHMDRPKGHWIRHEHSFWTFVNDKGERGGWIPDYECNLCGSRGWEYAMNFCPNCGARMKGADDE